MQRTILALILSVALVAIGFVVTRTPSSVQTETPLAAEALSTTTSDEPRTTSTTAPPSSSSTEALTLSVATTPNTTETTTTTVAATTPTTAGAATSTTTTKPPNTAKPPISTSSLAIPATVTYPGNLKATGGYSITASNADTGVIWWSAPYLGTNLPYLPGSKWVAGDREGYRCAYGFVMDANGDIDGRFAFV